MASKNIWQLQNDSKSFLIWLISFFCSDCSLIKKEIDRTDSKQTKTALPLTADIQTNSRNYSNDLWQRQLFQQLMTNQTCKCDQVKYQKGKKIKNKQNNMKGLPLKWAEIYSRNIPKAAYGILGIFQKKSFKRKWRMVWKCSPKPQWNPQKHLQQITETINETHLTGKNATLSGV